ncbi:hypothetical protein P7C70_g3874, partial [Phenoliferia sp. Uapishka_3]
MRTSTLSTLILLAGVEVARSQSSSVVGNGTVVQTGQAAVVGNATSSAAVHRTGGDSASERALGSVAGAKRVQAAHSGDSSEAILALSSFFFVTFDCPTKASRHSFEDETDLSLSSASATAIANTGSNPLIPTTISSGCTRFLEYLNTDTAIASCSTPLRTALSLFAPSSASTYSATSAQVASSLSALCSTAPCSDSLLRSTLSHFNGNCSTELQAGNDIVVDSYDAIYTLGPFLTAICTKDVAGAFCLSDIVSGTVPTASAANATSVAVASASALALGNSTTFVATNKTVLATTNPYNVQQYVLEAAHPAMLFFSAATSSVAKRLVRRAASGNSSSSALSSAAASSSGVATTTSSAASALPTTGVLVNSTTFASSSLPFLLLSTNMSSSVLCTPCTKSILAPYVSFEARSPYALGLANSKLLGHQGTLWAGIAATCGEGFVSSIATMAGESSTGLTGAASGLQSGAWGGFGMALVALLSVVLL